MIKVIVFGTFDVVHPGHLYFLKEARKFGNYLTVVIGRDRTVNKVKGKLPVNNENERLEKISKLPRVDKVVLGNLDDMYKIIEDLKPNMICLGYDQDSFTKNLQVELLKRHISAKIIRLGPYKAHQYKSSKLKQ